MEIGLFPSMFRILQIPFNLGDNTFIECFNTHRTVFVRSIFKRGELIRPYGIKSCLNYVKLYRPDGIIVGVKSSRELEEIIKANG